MSNFPTHLKTMSVILLCCLFTIPGSFAQPKTHVQATELIKDSPKLMLIGGGLNVCREMLPTSCNSHSELISGNLAKKYQLSPERLEKLKSEQVFLRQSPSLKLQLNTVFEYFYANKQTVNGVSGLLKAFEQSPLENGGEFFINLPDDIYFALQDFTEVTIGASRPIAFSDSTGEILSRFIAESATKQKADQNLNIVLVTAGYRDAHSAALFYQRLFTQLISQTTNTTSFSVDWLPLDIALADALRLKNKGIDACNRLADLQGRHNVFNRQEVAPNLVETQLSYCQNPKQFVALINSAHGVFFADGDTQRLLDSLKGLNEIIATPVATQVTTYNLLVAGDGAGARVISGGVFANRPIPILTGGKSEVALIRGAFALPPAPRGCEQHQGCPDGMITDDLTFMPSGGFNLLPFGIVDTQFSEQDRTARLALLAAQTKTRFGIGIDEETVLVVSQRQNDMSFNTYGSGGVMFVDLQSAIFKSQSGKHQLIGLSHYINHGDSALFNTKANMIEIRFNASKETLSAKTMLLQLKPGEFRRQLALNCGMTSFHRWTNNDIAWLVNPVEDTVFTSGEYDGISHCSYANLLFGIEN